MSDMESNEIIEKLNAVFRDVFDDEGISVGPGTTAKDIDGWDSLIHITLINAVEDEFDVKFEMKDVVGFKNVGDMIEAIKKEL